ncbi:MAG: PAS domain S-box protein [Deltaproteobacteria bacterium]|nr:PAS domain S-box protein [Deltaproteobacteria bacterium]
MADHKETNNQQEGNSFDAPIKSPSWWIQVTILSVTTIAIGITAFLGFQTFHVTRQTALDQFNEHQLILARSAAAGIETYFSEVKASLVSATKVSCMQDMNPGCLEYMQTMYLGFIPRTSIRRIDEYGVLRFIYPSDDWRGDIIGRNYDTEPYFNRTKETGHVTLYGITVNEQGEKRIRMSAPIYVKSDRDAQKKRFAGVLVISFDLQSVGDIFISPIVSGETGYAWLMDQKGYFLAHYEADFVGQDAFKAREKRNPELSYESINEIQQKVMTGSEGIGYYMSGWHRGKAGKIEKLIAYSPVYILDQIWSVAVVAPVSEIDRIIRTAGIQALNTFAFIILFLIIAGIFSSLSVYRWSGILKSEVQKRTRELRETTDYLNNLIRCANAPIVVLDRDGKTTIFNEAFERMSGQTEQEMIGRPLDILFPDTSRSASLRQLTNAQKGNGDLHVQEMQIMRRDGKVRIGMWNSANIYAEPEKILIATIIHGEDVTERKKVEEALRQNEERFRKVFEGGALGMAILDLEYRFERINATFSRMLGYDEAELIGRTFIDVTHPEHQEQDLRQVAQLLQGNIPYYKTQKRYVRKDGESIWGNVTASVVYDESIHPLYFIAMIEDITDQKRSEQEKEQLERQLLHAQKMEALGTLVAGVAHEINNPINKIMFDIPLLQKVWHDALPVLEKEARTEPEKKYGGLTYGFLKENLSQLLSDIDLAANRVAKTVNNLKHFTRQSSITDKAPIEINTAVTTAVRLIETTLKKSRIVLELDLAKKTPVIEGTLQSIEQIIMNIAINATQAIDHDHGKITISTGHQKKNGKAVAVISISDNGKGIDPAIADKIFDPFVTSRQAEGGTGLGLSITCNLVEAHVGEITFLSKEGEGTTFTITFPAITNKKSKNR